MLHRIPAVLVGIIAIAFTGCDSAPRFAAVSGRITLDGKPVANAIVMFQPIPPAGKAVAAAAGSNGKTNANGEFTLRGTAGEAGAWVGKHTVMIELGGDDTSSEVRPRGGKPQVSLIPGKYNTQTTLTFEVPKEGTTTANFELDSK
ncbi:hypothetical protein BH11PLA2_BH11PLA2_27620 [soil metagenome]